MVIRTQNSVVGPPEKGITTYLENAYKYIMYTYMYDNAYTYIYTFVYIYARVHNFIFMYLYTHTYVCIQM